MKVLSKMQHMCLEMSCLVNKSFLSVHFLVTFLLLISLLHTRALAHNRSTAAGGTNTDFHALLAFKSKILPDAAREAALSSWNESLHFCEWQGVKCSHRHKGRVTFINLTSKGLVGSLSPHIGNLSFLQVLLLDNNSFMGEIPTQLGNLSRVQTLNLSLNSFEGKIPANLFRCSELVMLSLDRNKLVGELPKHFAYSMPKLAILFIRDNNLTGGIPPFIGNLTSLERFSARYNPLGGSIPDTLGHLKNLLFLGLGATKISGIIPHSIYNLSSLITFSVPDNQLWGSLPPSNGFMFPRLKVLQLDENQFTGSLPLSISNCSQLLQLELQTNHFSGKVTTDFRNMKNLTFVALFDNSFGSGEYDELDFLGSMPNSSNLRVLLLARNQFKGVLPDFVGNLSSNLRSFTMNENLIYGTIPSTIGNLVSLEVLVMSSNQFTGEIPYSLGYLHKLQLLDIGGNKLSEYGLGNKMSTSGDVYSYGILLLEMITGKRPTDKMFKAGLNLHNFARMALAEQRVMEIVDPLLLAQEENGSIMVESLLIPMIKIGLACSTESPRDRMSLSNVLRELHLVKNMILMGGMDS